jgi:hypothetical protein
LTRSMGRPAIWPLDEDAVDPGLEGDELFDLVEVFFDWVAGPRKASWHAYCGDWDYSDHDRRAGQRVYLWRVNELLTRSDVGLELSTNGADRGQLVVRV